VDEDQDAPRFAAPAEKLILAVDDDDNIRSLLELIATSEGFRFASAVDGLSAAEVIEKEEPDLIVADLMMPRRGGYEFVRELQASGHGSIPVFIITGSAMNASTTAMIRQERNVVEFISKPIRSGTFTGLLHKHLKTTPGPKPRTRGLNDRP
jgi:CheY-like chemotaxis protein